MTATMPAPTRASAPVAAGSLPATTPFEFGHTLWFVKQFLSWRGEQLVTPVSITKAISDDGQPYLFTVRASRHGVAYELHTDAAFDEHRHQALRTRISDYLGLEDDLGPFYRRSATDAPAFAEIVRRFHGFHHTRFPSLVENASWQIMAAGFRQTVAHSMKTRLVEAVGGRISRDGTTYRTFPELDDLLGLSIEDVNGIIRNSRRAGFLVRMWRDIADIDTDLLAHGDYHRAVRTLRTVTGIGPWSASGILMRHYGRMDSIPMSMDAFADAAREVYGADVDLESIARRYGDQIGYWSWYLKNGLVPEEGKPHENR